MSNESHDDAVDACLLKISREMHGAGASPLLRFRRAKENDVHSVLACLSLSRQREREEFQVEAFGEEAGVARCLVLEEEGKKEGEFSIRDVAVWYFGYSTWEGRCLHVARMTAAAAADDDDDRRHRQELLLYALAHISTTLNCARMVWETWESHSSDRQLYDSVGAETLAGWLTLRLEGDKMAQFLGTRDEACNNPPAVASPSKSPHRRRNHESILQCIQDCLQRGNAVLAQGQEEGQGAPSRIRLRCATREDAGSIMKLVHGLALYEKEPEAVKMDTETLERDGFGPHPLFYCILLENLEGSRAEPFGMGLFYFGYRMDLGRFLYLEDLYVDERFRGKGGGKSVMYAIADVALQLQCLSLEWQALDWNTPALTFYQNVVGARILEGKLRVRFDRDRLTNFLHQTTNGMAHKIS